MGMKKPKSKAKASPNAKSAEQRSRREEEDARERAKVMAMVKTLITVERDGNLRGFVSGAINAIRDFENKSDDWKSPAARSAETIREAVALYLHTLLNLLDVGTKREIVTSLISDFWRSTRASHDDQILERANSKAAQRDAALALMAIMRKTTTYYCKIAEQGDPEVSCELPMMAIQIVECLNGMVRKRPELFRSVASERATWPIMAAKNYPKASDFAKLTEQISLGSDCTVSPHKAQKWKPDTPMNVFLLRFFGGLVLTEKECYWRMACDESPKLTPRTVRLWLDEIIMPGLDHIREKEGSWQGIKVLAELLKKVPYEAEHRRHVRNRIKAALQGMARGVKD